MSFLAVDIGNTRLKWALYDRPAPQAVMLAHGAEFLENIDKLADGPWKALPVPQRMLGCVVAGDALKRRVEEQMEIWPQLEASWVVPSAQQAGVTNGYDLPTRLGADRWVAIIGAYRRMLHHCQGRPLRPVLLVMVGTAVTIEAIDPAGLFLGGMILPGHGIMLRALESGTAGLHVPTGNVTEFPTNTSDALTSGGTFAIAGAVQRMVRHVQKRCGLPPMCIMTGGAGWKMAPYMETPFELVESLIFEGLLCMAEEPDARTIAHQHLQSLLAQQAQQQQQ